MAKELSVPFDVLRGLVSDHFKKIADGPADVQAAGIVPAGYELPVFDSLSVEIEAGMRRSRSRPPEEEGFTYRKMALELGRDWNVEHVLDAAGFFATKEHSRMVGRMVLDARYVIRRRPTGGRASQTSCPPLPSPTCLSIPATL
jgi:hypothetical protein